MSDASDGRGQLRAHLQFYGELGVTGFSRDPRWRRRPHVAPGQVETGAAPLPMAASADDDVLRVPDVAEDSLRSHAEQADALASLQAHIGPSCQRCKLCALGRQQVVYGVGNPAADLMIIGEAPGADEDVQGIPFVGRAGQLLTKIIEAIDLRRDDVYIANVIKCRPPGNRNPEPDEVATCEPFLLQQIDIVQPRVVVALGKFAAQTLLQTDTPITRLRGQAYPFRDAALVPTFHPAYLLRSPDKKRETWEDMKLVRALLRGEAR